MLFCTSCGAAQPEDNPPLKPGVRCVKCQQSSDYTTIEPTLAWKAKQGLTENDKRFLRSLRIAPEDKKK